MTAGLVGTSGIAAILTITLDLPLVKRLRRSPHLWVRVPIATDTKIIKPSLGTGADEKEQQTALALPAIR